MGCVYLSKYDEVSDNPDGNGIGKGSEWDTWGTDTEPRELWFDSDSHPRGA